jgi:hypothetical protein
MSTKVHHHRQRCDFHASPLGAMMSQLGIGHHSHATPNKNKAGSAKFYVDVDPPPKTKKSSLRVPEHCSKKSKFLKKSSSTSSFLNYGGTNKKESKYGDIFNFFKPHHHEEALDEKRRNGGSVSEMLSSSAAGVETADFDFVVGSSSSVGMHKRRGALILDDFDDFGLDSSDSETDSSSGEEDVELVQLNELVMTKEDMTEFAAFIYGVGYLSWTKEGE